MAETKGTNDLDDWLDDLPEEKSAAAELDQADIDALMGGGAGTPADGQGRPSAGRARDGGSPAAVAAPAAAEENLELSQNDIDALLGGTPAPKTVTPPPAAAPEGSGDLSQDDIDALFGTSSSVAPAAVAPSQPTGSEADLELSQDDIDALLGGGTPPVAAAATAPTTDTGFDGELSQSDIDALLGGGDETSAPDTGLTEFAGELSQGDIDALLSDGSGTGLEGKAGGGADKDFMADILADTGLQTDGKLAQDVTFAEILDDGSRATVFGTGSDEKTVLEQGLDEDLAAFITKEAKKADAAGKEGKGLPPFMTAALSKKVLGVMATLGLLLAAAGVAYFKMDHMPANRQQEQMAQHEARQEETPAQHQEPKVEEKKPADRMEVVSRAQEQPAVPVPTPEKMPNSAPVVGNIAVQIKPGALETAVQLQGQDKDGDVLSYEIVAAPKHGRLSGSVPNLLYLPDNTFSGEDGFEYRSTDGKDYSAAASVRVTGPDLRQPLQPLPPPLPVATVPPPSPHPLPAPPSVSSEPAPVTAADITLNAKEDKALVIDWEKIWHRTNKEPFTGVTIAVIDPPRQGSLREESEQRYVYDPPPKFAGHSETFTYQFTRGQEVSPARTVTVRVPRPDRPPKIQLAQPDRVFLAGEKVVIDASKSKDEARDTLRFSWEQTDGVKIAIQPVNPEGSIVSFVMPSTFTRSPGPVIRLTVTDKANQQDRAEIPFKSVSRHQSPLWNGTPTPSREVTLHEGQPPKETKESRKRGSVALWGF